MLTRTIAPAQTVKPTNVRWIVLAGICALYFVTYLDRVNISLAAPSITAELRLSPTELGLIFSAFSVAYAALQIPGGWVADRIGSRKALSGMGLLWALFTALTALPAGLTSMLLVRLGVGVAEAGAFPAATRAFTTWIPSNRRGFAQGLPHSFARLGGALAPPIVIGLILAFGWRMAFVGLGAASLVWVTVWVWFYRDRPRDHWLTNVAEVELLDAQAPALDEALKPGRTAWRALIARMWPVTLADFCYGWSLWVFLTWLPSYLSTDLGVDQNQLALFAALPLAAGVVGDTAGGLLSDALWRRGRTRLARSGQIAIGLVLSLVFVLPAVFASSPIVTVWLLSASFLCLEMTNAPLWASAMDITRQHVGEGSGLMNTGFGVAGIISPVVFGALIQATGNWTLPFVLSAALLLVGAGLALRIDAHIGIDG